MKWTKNEIAVELAHRMTLFQIENKKEIAKQKIDR